MKRRRWVARAFGALTVLCILAGIYSGRSMAAEKGSHVSILFTHDMHSHINSFQTVYKGEDVNIGGFARIQSIINRQREKDPETLLVDGGDFSMGSLFQTVYETQASELRLMGFRNGTGRPAYPHLLFPGSLSQSRPPPRPDFGRKGHRWAHRLRRPHQIRRSGRSLPRFFPQSHNPLPHMLQKRF